MLKANFEPNLKTVVEVLSKKYNYESNDEKNLINDDEIFLNLFYFFKEEQINSLYAKIKEVYEKDENEKYINIFSNLLMLYPFSLKILEKLLKDIENNEFDYFEKGYNILEFLVDYVNSFLKTFDANLNRKNKEIENIKKILVSYEMKKEEAKEKLKNIEKVGFEDKQLAKEVEDLEKECKRREKEYSKEGLEEKKRELKSKKIKLEEIEKEQKKVEEELNEVIEILREIEKSEKIKNGDNFNKIKTLTKQIEKTLI